MHNLKKLAQAVKNGNNMMAVSLTGELLANGVPIEHIVEKGLTEPLNSLSSKCTTEDLDLLEIMLAGRAMMDVMDVIVRSGKNLNENSVETRVVLGTIKGDIHDLGRKVVKIVFTLAGIKVFDLGVDVEPERFVEAALKYNASIIAVSSLITIASASAKEIRKFADSAGLESTKIIAGGAGFRISSEKYLHVDYIAQTVFDGLDYVLALGKEGQR
ncbi:MAG: cobalamin-dependent protein [Desulfitobacteriaceae bacterium]|nr:cobalamin-dependent protein [Desulfitobacteriaceae bacterium]